MNNKIDLNFLIKITAEILRKNGLYSLEGIKPSRKNQNNIIDQICFKFFRNFKYTNKLRIYQLWQRNSNFFKDLLKKEQELFDEEK